ncbi:MAG: hypothetical protein IJH12_02295 [Clostridia bacterium]|nr:hypothetical protein [Clostridia bacterium]
MGVIEAIIRKDIAEFFEYLVEKCLAKDTYKAGKITVTGERWTLTNIAEVLSSEGVICEVFEDENHCELCVRTAECD